MVIFILSKLALTKHIGHHLPQNVGLGIISITAKINNGHNYKNLYNLKSQKPFIYFFFNMKIYNTNQFTRIFVKEY